MIREFKQCISCKETKLLSSFYKHKCMADGFLGRCRSCHIDGQRDARYKRIYGITRTQYEELLKFQDGRCAICKSDSPGTKHENFHVDHDHRTGEIRGLLCLKCNTLLANAKEDTQVLLAAVEYLQGRLI